MIKRINLIIATVYSIVLAVVEALLNWGDWQYAPLWIVDYLIVIILLLGVFVYKENQQCVFIVMGTYRNNLFLLFCISNVLFIWEHSDGEKSVLVAISSLVVLLIIRHLYTRPVSEKLSVPERSHNSLVGSRLVRVLSFNVFIGSPTPLHGTGSLCNSTRLAA